MNENYRKLQSSYLFSKIAKKVTAFQEAQPKVHLIKLGIGDVTHALTPNITRAFHSAVDEQSQDHSFRGYGPEQGYEFLRQVIADVDFKDCDIDAQEVFISDGSKCDSGNFQEIFADSIRIAIPDPVYPVYVDSNVMAGRSANWKDGRYGGFFYLEGNEENNFVPIPPSSASQSDSMNADYDLIYLCFPNNPTGTTASRKILQSWVDYAHKHRSLILFDAAYTAFIRDYSIPRSIFEIPGSHEVAVEFRSLSKTAGFTGIRCAYTVIPKKCRIYDQFGNKESLWELWFRRQSTKFNGVSYPVQRAAAAVFNHAGQEEIKQRNNYYLQNALLIRECMLSLNFKIWGGENSPYIWIRAGESSWQLFDQLLNEAAVVTTPGAGFGRCGEGYIRISSFNQREHIVEALDRIALVFKGKTVFKKDILP